ncbi:MAG: group I intron-associated PD-(D/E)XK endonuclease [Nitriliruptor sp.]
MHEPQLDLGTEPAPADHAADHQAAHLAKADRRPPDTLWRANPREQGLLGLTDAIAFFGAQGWSVSLPLIDSQPYDLIVDDGARLQRVQVKTTTRRSRNGRFVVQVCTRGGNRSFHTSKDFDASGCELLYVLTDDRERYLIPTSEVRARTALTLGARMAPFLLPRAQFS